MESIDVPIAGSASTIVVHICHENFPIGGLISAPDTRHTPVFVSHDRGENFHGSLLDEYFVSHNCETAMAEWIILWLACNCDQSDDDVSRLAPVALLPADWQAQLPDNLSAQLTSIDAATAAGAVLFWAWMHHCRLAFESDLVETESVRGGAMITDDWALAVARAGAEGAPLALAAVLGSN